MRGSKLLLGIGQVLILSLGVCGCGPEAPPPVAPVAPPKPSAEPPKKAQVAEDRSPVDAPAGLAVQGHSIGLKTLIKGVRPWLPATTEVDPRMLVTEVASPTLERLVDIDKPVDLAVSIGQDKEPRFAIAFGVEDGIDVADAVKDNYRVEPLPGGVLKLLPNSGGKAHCVVAPAIGVAKHRLVCTRLGDDPLPLTPWLARGVTRKEAIAAAVRFDVDATILKKTFGSELDKGRAFARGDMAADIKTGYDALDKALKPIAKSVADEVFDAIDDLDALVLEASPAADGLQASLTTSFSGAKSWTARAMLAGGDTPSPANPRLAKLPGDGGWLGLFQRGNPQNDALIAPFQSAAREVVLALATDFKWPAKDRELALDVVKLAFPASADLATVTGHEGQVAWPDGAPKPYGDLARASAAFLLSKSWSVSVAERDPKIPVGLAKALYAWAARPSFAQTYKALTKDRLAIKVTTKPLALKDLPKGAFAQHADIELSIPKLTATAVVEGDQPKGKAAPKASKKEQSLLKLTSDTIVAPEGNGRAWVGIGHNLADGELWKRLSGAMTGNPPNTLGARPHFDFLATGTPTSGGLLTLDGLVRTFLGTNKGEKVLGQLPDQGRGALVWRFTPSKPPKASGELAVFVPRDFITAAFFAARF